MDQHGGGKIDLKGRKRIVLVGNPNVGKSVIFSLLTGKYVTVSNYPGTTVEVTQGTSSFGHKEILIIDTPGANSLVPHSEDERVTRDILLNVKPDAVVQVADAKNLRRTLLITLQLIEMGFPLILDLNMRDEADQRRIRIDSKRLSSELGIGVIETVATEKRGLPSLLRALAAPKTSDLRMDYGDKIEPVIGKMEDLLPNLPITKRATAVMLLAGDQTIKEWMDKKGLLKEGIKEVEGVIGELEAQFGQPLSYLISRARRRKIEQITGQVLEAEPRLGALWTEKLGRWMMSSLLGPPILILVLWLLYKFVGVLGAQTGVDFLEGVVFGRYINPWVTKAVNLIVPLKFIRDALVGEYGLITMGLTYSVAIVGPVVCTFFLAFGILEDSGYLPRMAVLLNRIFRGIGLSGKAVLPMVLGLGCDTMATLTTRILETKKERVITTLLLALGVPCSAQLGVILAMLAAISTKALVLVFGVVISQLILVGYLASKIVPGRGSDFMLEIPPLRVPKLSNVFIKTLTRLQWFLNEAVPLFLLGTFALFVSDKLGLLQSVQKAVSPIVQGFLGLPVKATEAFIIGFLRRDYGAAGLYALSKAGQLSDLQVVVSMVVITLFVPCIAHFFVIIKEHGLKTALYMVAFIFALAILVGGVLNFGLRFSGVSL
ncbi:MAG: ferrous iron transport protein B [bacterium]